MLIDSVRSFESDGPDKGRATIQDVATKAGVSTMSVSRVLNNRKKVSAETRDRVMHAVTELNYVPNHAAKKLAERRQSHNIAFLFGAANAAVLGQMVTTTATQAVSSGAELVFIKVPPERDPGPLRKSLANLGIQGVILSPPLCEDAGLRNALSAAGTRLVAVGTDSSDQAHSAIGIDDTLAAFQLTQHLLRLGHRRIAFIGGPPWHQSSARRRSGYEAALLEFRMELDQSLQWQGEYTYASALAAAEQALGSKQRPTAVLAANDDMAAAVLTVAERRGLAVPDALTVCGFDDSEIAQIVSPQLTTISQPLGAMTRWAVRQLVRELSAMDRGEEPEVRKAVLHHRIVRRGSDAPPLMGRQPNEIRRVRNQRGPGKNLCR